MNRSRLSTFLAVLIALVLLSTPWPSSTYGRELPDIPSRLSDAEFWQLVEGASEADATFLSDNLVSNEMSFAQVVPALATLPKNGAYLGVGPEQNFTYIAALRPAIAFIIDIRRDNLRLQLLYKALFEMADDRADFLSLLFARARPAGLLASATVADLMRAYEAAPKDDGAYERNLQRITKRLTEQHAFPLSNDDTARVAWIYEQFATYGPSIDYITGATRGPNGAATILGAGRGVALSRLMAQTGRDGESFSFLASVSGFRAVKSLEERNLVVPVVGNFAGPKAIRSVGVYLRQRQAVVTAFYVSNVEDYLGHSRNPIPQNGEWQDFCENVAALPLNEGSVFVRPLGLATFAADGSLTVSPSMQIASQRERTTYAAGQHVDLPSPLSPILPEVKGCGAAGVSRQ